MTRSMPVAACRGPAVLPPLAGIVLALLIVLSALLPATAAAQPASAAPQPGWATAQEPGSELVVGLLTMGQGDLVYELFGHNAIWIQDPIAGTSRVYNYGVFDFASPGYWSRFIRGTWLYQLAVYDLSYTLDTYRFLNRSVWLQVLNLSPAQKRELRDFLEWNALPQHREYLYDYFRDNCSTRVRDALDRVLGGTLRAATAGVPTGTTFRWHTERLIASDPFSYTGVLIGLGPAADRGIDLWEEMFIPFTVQEQVRRLRVPDDAGRMVPLVAREETLFMATRPPERAVPPRRLHWFLLGGVGLAGLVALPVRASRRSRAARRSFALAGALWGALSGAIGLLLLGLWTLTNHAIAYDNASLLQMNPLALGLIVLVPAAAAGAPWAARPARALAAMLAVLSLLGLVLWIVPWWIQQNGALLAFALPVHLAVAFAVWRLGAPDVGRVPRHARMRRGPGSTSV